MNARVALIQFEINIFGLNLENMSELRLTILYLR